MLGAAGLAVPSTAAAADTLACELQGTAVTAPPVNLVGGSGTYQFTNALGSTGLDFNCVASDGSGFSVDQLSASSSGSYNDTACGTGALTSSDAQNTVVVRHVGGTENLSGLYPLDDFGYKIEYVAGVGVFTFTDPAITGGGAVSISEAGDANPAGGQCTTRFTVAGALAGVLNADPV